jgi:hypothetical protein
MLPNPWYDLYRQETCAHDTHRTHIMDKLGLHNRIALVKYALQRGILESN